ncbi:MAG TPA: hypothetical protein PLP17_05085 [Oligoflexia bacterium]|nr:hypothetical protein [Oligoflexia bacterium]
MRRKSVAVLFVIISFTAPAFAQSSGFGLGPTAGDPMGLSAKYWLDDQIAVDAVIGWAMGDHDSVQLHGDYLYHLRSALPGGMASTKPYVGIGPRLTFSDEEHEEDTTFGLRFPIGLSIPLKRDPLEIFAEIAPGMDLAPDAEFELEWGVGFRFYFE